MMGAQCYGECRGNVSFLLTDSRSLCFPEETLFFALRSARNDGQHYIAELYQRGVRRFVVAEVPDRWQANYADATLWSLATRLLPSSSWPHAIASASLSPW